MKFKVGDRINFESWLGKILPGTIMDIRRLSSSEPYKIRLDNNKGEGYVSGNRFTLRMIHNRNGANE